MREALFETRDSAPAQPDRVAAWRALEARGAEIDIQSRAVEQAAALLEGRIRALARDPQKLLAHRSELEREARATRDRREALDAARAEHERAVKRFWAQAQRERASRPAVHLEAEVDARSEHNFWTGIDGGLDRGGLFFATHAALEPGTPVCLDLRLAGQAPVRLSGQVSWVRELHAFTRDAAPGVGLALDGVPEELARAISAFMHARDPVLFEI
ncbi:MAG: PilZ domain-containing protein [Deltaproteobacteria bacterium]|nr:PilZ domain-containing protein [Deltaproteobacteria bacterium]